MNKKIKLNKKRKCIYKDYVEFF